MRKSDKDFYLKKRENLQMKKMLIIEQNTNDFYIQIEREFANNSLQMKQQTLKYDKQYIF